MFGEKTRNPGYKPGDHWLHCDRCGFVIRSSKARKEWTGLVVCPECFDTRNPQDFRKARKEHPVRGLVRVEPADTFRTDLSPVRIGVARAGVARAGNARAGYGMEDYIPPSGTYSGSRL